MRWSFAAPGNRRVWLAAACWLVAVAGVAVSGWLVSRDRYVDDEVDPSAMRRGEVVRDVIEVAGDEPPVVVHVREPDGGSPRG